MAKFIKKPIVVEAITFEELVNHGIASGAKKYNGTPWSWEYNGHAISHENDECYLITTLEGTMQMTPNDMLITGVQGEIYPCKKDIFESTYDIVVSKNGELTFGEKSVGLSFNPSNDDKVGLAKKYIAQAIDLLESDHAEKTDSGKAMSSCTRNVFRTNAFTQLVNSSKALVTYLTWKD